jgi:hypothetical protein
MLQAAADHTAPELLTPESPGSVCATQVSAPTAKPAARGRKIITAGIISRMRNSAHRP